MDNLSYQQGWDDSKQECAAIGRENDEMRAEISSLREEVQRLRDALVKNEYISIPNILYGSEWDCLDEYRFCPECGYKNTDGHYRDCTIGNALEKENE